MKDFMIEALNEANKALKKGEVPIGAIIVKNNKIISRGYNQREKKQNALLHAEMIAINKACKKLRSWRLENCDLYVTLEPCPMCAGAIVNARLRSVTYGAKEKTSSDCLLEKILTSQRLNHNCDFKQDKTHEEECSNLLTTFFKNKRNKKG